MLARPPSRSVTTKGPTWTFITIGCRLLSSLASRLELLLYEIGGDRIADLQSLRDHRGSGIKTTTSNPA